MLVIDLVKNVALLVALVVLFQVTIPYRARNARHGKAVFGILLGVGGLLVMLTPADYGNGIIFDSRTILLFVGAVFGGPWVAAIGALIMGAYRWSLGGSGVWVGLSTIAMSGIVGSVYYFWRLRTGAGISAMQAWLGGLAVHVVMLLMFLLLPGGVGVAIVREIWPAILLAYPLATMVVCLLFQDYDQRERDRERLRRLAYYDGLTGLPNRQFMVSRIQQQLEAAVLNARYGALILIHLDRFSRYNDARGHDFGDRLLMQVGKRLKACTTGEAELAHLTGSEFLVLSEGLFDSRAVAGSEISSLSGRLRDVMMQPFDIDGIRISVLSSIGISYFPVSETDTAGEVLRRADTAMHRAKVNGGNCSVIYESSMSTVAERQFHLERELRAGVPAGQLRAYLQSQVDASGRIVGAEALVRWEHPELGLVSPASFIPLAEETDLIVEVGNWMLERICTLLGQGAFPDTEGFRVSINISPRQFHQSNFVAHVQKTLARTGALPSALTFEVTESVLINDVSEVVQKMKVLSAMGIRFSLDDFGTGYASLTYVKDLPIHELKIDKAFVHEAPVNSDSAALVESILAVAKHMKLVVVAEGVETPEQVDFLRLRGHDVVYQGYLYSRPQAADAWLDAAKNCPPAPGVSAAGGNDT
ncbi:MAG: EAL domain-containing protein [Pusillimonas sp.]